MVFARVLELAASHVLERYHDLIATLGLGKSLPLCHVDADIRRVWHGLLQSVHGEQEGRLTRVTLDRSNPREIRGIPTRELQVRGVGKHRRSAPWRSLWRS